MYRTEYYESVDYTWALARQLDRVAEAYTRVDPRLPGLGVKRLLMAVRALYVLASIWVPEGGRKALGKDQGLANANDPWRALELLLRELDKKGLLVRKQELPVGAYGGEE